MKKQPRRPPPPLVEMLKDDAVRIREDFRQRGWREVSMSFTALEAFYLTEEERARLRDMNFLGRWLRRLWWLVKSLLMKLTPIRRVLLAIALVNIVSGGQRIEIGQWTISLVGIGEILLVVILMLELKDKLIAREELEAGRVVQLALMPPQSPPVPGWELWLHNEPANDVGGDLVDHLQIDARRHGVALGDVAGKALPAALLMVKLQATLRALVPQFDALGDLGAAVNRILQRDGLPNRFATLIYLLLTERSGDVRLLNAGHLPPVVVRRGVLDWQSPGSLALGIMPDASFTEQHVELSEGDVLIAFSDGLSEAMSPSGEYFGDERLGGVIRQAAGQPASVIGDRLLQAVRAFVGDAPQHDDVSLLVVRRVAG